jgi:hypothetical protein
VIIYQFKPNIMGIISENRLQGGGKSWYILGRYMLKALKVYFSMQKSNCTSTQTFCQILNLISTCKKKSVRVIQVHNAFKIALNGNQMTRMKTGNVLKYFNFEYIRVRQLHLIYQISSTPKLCSVRNDSGQVGNLTLQTDISCPNTTLF